MNYGKPLTLMLAAFMGACNAAPPVDESASVKLSSESDEMLRASVSGDKTRTSKDGFMGELNQFVEPSAKILTSQISDLNVDGMQDAILVLDHAENVDKKLGEGIFRSLLLLTRDDAGQLQKTRQSDKIVPCAKCGGVAGDPFGYVRAENGGFTVFIEGGSRERWSDEYYFQYSADRKDWLLNKIMRSVSDTITTQDKKIELGQKDFGTIAFEDFDPSKMPPLAL